MKAEQTADIEGLLAHAGWLRRFALALVKDGDDAEDLAQDTMVSAWRNPAEGAGRAWLARVARNLAVDRFRTTRSREWREQAATSAQPGQVANPEELVAHARIHRAVAEVVAGLAEPFRQTLVLRYYEGQTSADIARSLGVPEGTVRWRLKQGLERVRRELDQRHGGDRASWVGLLAPLMPRSAPRQRSVQARPEPRSLSPVGAVTVALLGASLVSLAVIGFAIHARPARPVSRAQETTSTVNDTTWASGGPLPVRLNLAHQPSLPAGETAQPAPGPGRLDAQALAEQLLQAIQDNDYDGFVARGSAQFRAAVPVRVVAELSTKLAVHLAQGRRVSTLGSVRRTETMDWLFKIEFSNGVDDALVTVITDGWQVAGFYFDDPAILPKEK